MSKQYAVIGLGKFGFAVATTLAQAGKEVLAVDKDPELVQEIGPAHDPKADLAVAAHLFGARGHHRQPCFCIAWYQQHGCRDRRHR